MSTVKYKIERARRDLERGREREGEGGRNFMNHIHVIHVHVVKLH